MVCEIAGPRCRMRNHCNGRLAAIERTGLRLAYSRARMGEPEPQCIQSVDGALLRRNRHARGDDALGRAWHDAATRTLGRARSRAARHNCKNAISRAAMVAGLPAARLLVRADISQT